MCSERRCFVAVAALWWAGLTPVSASAESLELVARPAQCIALHRGQPCYQEVVLSWGALDAQGTWCLLSDAQSAPLRCWQGGAVRQHVHAYASADTERFSIRRDGSGAIVAKTRVTTVWVYREPRRGSSGWRLF